MNESDLQNATKAELIAVIHMLCEASFRPSIRMECVRHLWQMRHRAALDEMGKSCDEQQGKRGIDWL